jgi:tetratricopeptide (TPR) repeat protein
MGNKKNIIILIFIVLAVYINSIFNPFIFDDFALITGNPYIKNFANFQYYFTTSLFRSPNSSFYRPLQVILYAVVYHLFGLHVAAYHLLNIFLQAGNAILIYILLKKIYSEKISFLVSALWAIAPIQTQAVTYMSGTADPLCLFFTLLCILLFSQKRYIYAFFSFILALLSKETAVLIPFLIYIYEYSRVSSSYSLPSERTEKNNLFKIWTVPLSTFLGISVLYAVLRLTILVKFKPAVMGGIPFLYRFYTSFQAFLQYIQILIFPNILAMQRYIPYIHTWKNPDFIVGFISFVLILYWLSRIRKNPRLFFPVIWFLINYLAISNVIIPVNSNVAEEWMYTPSIGAFILFILGYEILKDKIKINKKYAYVPLIIIFCLYGIRTIVRNHTWKNPIAFYKKTIKYFPSQKMYNNLAASYQLENKYHHEIKYFKITLKYPANNYTAFLGLGNAYLKINNLKQAEKYYKKAIELAPHSPLAYVGLAQVYIVKKNLKKEEEYLKKAIQVGPAYWASYYWLGILYLNTGKYNKAYYNLKLASVINPNHALIYNDLGVLYEQIGQPNKALPEFKKAYAIGYKDRTIILNLAEAYQVLGNYHKAIFYYQKALGLYPGDPVILNKLAIAFALNGNKQQAIRIWQTILKRYPNFPGARINLQKLK